MITLFNTDDMYFSLMHFMSYLEPPVCISGVGSFPLWSGDFLIFFSCSCRYRH